MGERRTTSIVLEAAASQVAAARRFVRAALTDQVAHISGDLQLIVSELFTNAIEHGRSATVEVVVRFGDDEVGVSVESRGPTPGVGAASDWEVAAPDALNGRGLGIVRRLADELIVERDGDGFVVTAMCSTHAHA